MARKLLPEPAADWCTKANAKQLAARIERYWAARGFAVEAWIVPCGEAHQTSAWAIKSDMRGGRPARRVEAVQ